MMNEPHSHLVYWIHFLGGAICIGLILGTDFRPLDFVGKYLTPNNYFVFAASAFEAIYLIGFYFPGTFLIIGVLLSASCWTPQFGSLLIAVWLGSTSGLFVSFAIGSVIGSGEVSNGSYANHWLGRWAPWVIGFHPNAAGSYVFHKAALKSLSLGTFIKVAISGMGFLALYGWLVCVAGMHFTEQQQEASIVWASLIMLVGFVGLLKSVIRGGRE
jgi:hypothetical protein